MFHCVQTPIYNCIDTADHNICNSVQVIVGIIAGSTAFAMVLIVIISLTTAAICFRRNKSETNSLNTSSTTLQIQPISSSTLPRSWEDDFIDSITTTTFGKNSDFMQHRDSAYHSENDSNNSSQNC